MLVIPLIDRVRWTSLQVDTADIPAQDLITKDNVTIRVEAAVFFRVVDPMLPSRWTSSTASRSSSRAPSVPRTAPTADRAQSSGSGGISRRRVFMPSVSSTSSAKGMPASSVASRRTGCAMTWRST